MQVSIRSLGNLAIPGFFRELRWLILTYQADIISLRSLLEALQNIPNLQFLYLMGIPMVGWRPGGEIFQHDLTDDGKVENFGPITFNELTILNTTNCELLHLINAPKLSYLQFNANSCHSSTPKTYDHLCGFDFSRITRIRYEITDRNVNATRDLHLTGNSAYGHWPEAKDGLWWLFHKWCDDHSFNFGDQFRLSIETHRWGLIPIFILYLKKSINLVEIILTGFEIFSLTDTEVTSFSNALKTATTVRDLTIISGDSLGYLCTLLSDKDLLPGLERLNYSANDHEKETSKWGHILGCVLTLLKKRLEASLMPLKIELGNFPLFQPQEVEQLESLDLEVIQKEGKLEITADPKKGEFISFMCTRLGI
ncbi:hypothetical protein Clacol_008738 [Clathrus columnatus]|uniref:Uncharacterized protein n=1 Tax=Clathrus columnatus TaxID=1419009 RepID=A0AAV5AIM0_9AGAM|nr:hypothetical protein Clacol_008738 [Clathrus columnatus]